eukprot:s670_g12.t1
MGWSRSCADTGLVLCGLNGDTPSPSPRFSSSSALDAKSGGAPFDVLDAAASRRKSCARIMLLPWREETSWSKKSKRSVRRRSKRWNACLRRCKL